MLLNPHKRSLWTQEFAEGLLDIFMRDVSVSSLQQMKLLRGVGFTKISVLLQL